MKRLASILFIAIIGGAPVVQAQASKQTPSAPPSKAPGKIEEDCGCDAKAPADLFAIVNGVKITAKDADEPIKTNLDSLRKQVTEARSRELYLKVNSLLLDAEAKKRRISSTKLLEQEVLSKVNEPTEAEAQAFYNQNKDRIEGEFKQVKSQLTDYLRNQRQSDEAKRFADRLRAGADVRVLVEKTVAPEKASDRAQVLAVVNGAKITSGDIEDALRPLIFSVQEQLYQLRKSQLDLAINNLLLEQEAQKRKITARALLEAEVKQKVKPVAEEDAKKFYGENKEKIKADYAQVKDQIIRYLQESEEHNAQRAFAEQLRHAATIQVFLTPPEPPAYEIATDDQPSKGNADAPVTIVEFTDYECSSCARTQPVIDHLLAEYAGKVRLVMRDFPLEKHANAFKAAEAAEAAREQGKYWQYVELLFQNQSALGIESLKNYAARLGLDRKKFDEALDTGRFSDKVQRDLQEGLRLGVNGTPALFVDGRLVKERSYEALKATIDAALSQKAKASAAGIKASGSKAQ